VRSDVTDEIDGLKLTVLVDWPMRPTTPPRPAHDRTALEHLSIWWGVFGRSAELHTRPGHRTGKPDDDRIYVVGVRRGLKEILLATACSRGASSNRLRCCRWL